MRKVKVVLPATVTNLGPGLNSLALALALHVTVEISERSDDSFTVETSGEGAGYYSTGLRHPVVLGLSYIFQKLERAPLGLTIRADSKIPPASGLGSEAAFLIAGVIAANNLFGNPFDRETIITLAAEVCQRPDHAVTAIHGGMTSSILDGKMLLYRRLPVQPSGLQMVVVVPELPQHEARPNLERVPIADALHNLACLPLVIDALRLGDLTLLAHVLEDRLIAPAQIAAIPGCEHVITVAKGNGASAVTLSGSGPALIAFAPANHRLLGDGMVDAFADAGVTARAWVVPLDTQGVVISMAQS
jgi:homoserine kinase